MPDQAQPTAARYAKRLRGIADMLGFPVEAFYRADGPDAELEVMALLQAWSAIEDDQGRRRVLSVAREEVERSIER